MAPETQAVPARDPGLVTLRAGTLRAPRSGNPPDRSVRIRAWPTAVLVVSALVLPYVLRFDGTHAVLAALMVFILAGAALVDRPGALVATTVYMVALGLLRRYTTWLDGFAESDPLLLVAPLVALFLVARSLMEGSAGRVTTLTRLVAALAVLMLVEIVNPLQGGLQVGLAGALFYLAPLLWFWVGRSSFITPQFMERFGLRVLLVLGVASVAWGLNQTWFGLLPFEKHWIEVGGYGALFIADQIRAIGFGNSSAEYQRLLLICAVLTVCAGFSGRYRLWLLTPLFFFTLFLSAARGPVVMFVLATAVLWSVRAATPAKWAPRFVVAAALGAGLGLGLLLFLQNQAFGSRIAPLVNRQVEGLLDPGNQDKSTATGHLQMIRDGLAAGLSNPAGRGLGASTRAADKYGGQTINSEVDFSNVMLSLGLIGGLLYLAIVATALLRAARWWGRTRRPAALMALGVLVSTLGSWLIGGEYSIAAIIWFYIGSMDRLADERGRSSRRAPGTGHP
ncbi:MAG: hypothetical protein JSS29_12250 [Proteobacteria bacterium]|nr:hypothetical protein [Pseudomonadota bacterium]